MQEDEDFIAHRDVRMDETRPVDLLDQSAHGRLHQFDERTSILHSNPCRIPKKFRHDPGCRMMSEAEVEGIGIDLVLMQCCAYSVECRSSERCEHRRCAVP